MDQKEYKAKMRTLLLREQVLKNIQLERQNQLLMKDYVKYLKDKEK